jgi:hypothetical protein
MNTMLEYVVYRTTGLEYIFQLLLPKMSVEANVRRFLRHSLVCATRLWGTLAGMPLPATLSQDLDLCQGLLIDNLTGTSNAHDMMELLISAIAGV